MPTKSTLQHIKTNLITGFLGVGKTSAILHLMQQKPSDEKWSVLVNEFGDVGIDGAIYEANGIAVKEIPGGCMCCAAGVPLQVAVNRLLKATRPQQLLIEPSGLGHPKRVLDTLRGEHFQGVLDIRSSICLIDPRNLLDERYTAHENFIDQIAMADVLVANKMDSCDTETEHYFDHYVNTFEPPKLTSTKTHYGHLNISLLEGVSDTQRKALHPDHHNLHNLHQHTSSRDSVTDSYVSTGYTFPSDTLFNYEKLITLFKQYPIERIKAVLRTHKGWKVFNIHNQQISTIDIKDSRDSRIEAIGRAKAVSRVKEDSQNKKHDKTLVMLVKSCVIDNV